jgi:hypothetical protein
MALSSPRDYRTMISAVSLVAGPLIMSIGDLLHPEERMAPAEQMAILVTDASRWYTAHLLLFSGMILFIPGLLALSALVGARRPAVGYAARILVLIGTAALSSVFVGEMLIGRFVLDGADPGMFSGPLLAAVGPAMLAFFVGTALFAIPLIRSGGGVGWSAATILVGALFILAEILSAEVVLSQIGNVLVFFGSTAIAWLILHRGLGHGGVGETA